MKKSTVKQQSEEKAPEEVSAPAAVNISSAEGKELVKPLLASDYPEPELDSLSEALPSETEGADAEKISMYRRFRNYWSNRKLKKDFEKETTKPVKTAPVSGNRSVTDFMQNVESQLGSIGGQNALLLEHIATLKKDNDILMEQVKVLKNNNEELYQQSLSSRKREKLHKIIAIAASALTITYTIILIITRFILKLF